MKRLALSCCALLLLTGAAAAKPGIAASTVNLRAEANTTSDVLAKIPAGARIDVGECNSGWCAVTFQGKSGFAIATALDTSGRPRPMAGPPGAPPPGYVPVPPPGYAGPPGVVYGPGPYYYGPGPYYYGPYYGGCCWGRGYGYGYGWRRW